MRIGIMSASLQGEDLRENRRLIDEITNMEHEAKLINYRTTAVGINELGRLLYEFDEKGKMNTIEVDAVIPRIGKFVDSGVLALQALVSHGIYSTADPESIIRAKDKMAAQIILDTSGIPTPHSIAPSGKTPDKPLETISFIESDGRPIIVKVRHGSKGKGVKLAETRRSARSIVDAEAPGYMIQEFIEAPEEENLHADIRLIVVEGRLITAMKRQASDKNEFRSNLAREGIGTPYEPTPREAELAIKSAEAIGLQVAGVDIMPSARGPLVTEVNVSPEFGIEEITGVNVAKVIAELAIRNALERSAPKPPLVEVEENL